MVLIKHKLSPPIHIVRTHVETLSANAGSLYPGPASVSDPNTIVMHGPAHAPPFSLHLITGAKIGPIIKSLCDI